MCARPSGSDPPKAEASLRGGGGWEGVGGGVEAGGVEGGVQEWWAVVVGGGPAWQAPAAPAAAILGELEQPLIPVAQRVVRPVRDRLGDDLPLAPVHADQLRSGTGVRGESGKGCRGGAGGAQRACVRREPWVRTRARLVPAR